MESKYSLYTSYNISKYVVCDETRCLIVVDVLDLSVYAYIIWYHIKRKSYFIIFIIS